MCTLHVSSKWLGAQRVTCNCTTECDANYSACALYVYTWLCGRSMLIKVMNRTVLSILEHFLVDPLGPIELLPYSVRVWDLLSTNYSRCGERFVRDSGELTQVRCCFCMDNVRKQSNKVILIFSGCHWPRLYISAHTFSRHMQIVRYNSYRSTSLLN